MCLNISPSSSLFSFPSTSTFLLVLGFSFGISEWVFLRKFLFCSQSGNHPLEDVEKLWDHALEDLAISGYKPNM
jgi:hypothetical protein